ncbi:MAG TPA: hypothetical protein VED67_00810, partial [Thermodesulfovibrionales bacterium]|nr:hypothetical protein [Thermodesulfovibrionales bacterium]
LGGNGTRAERGGGATPQVGRQFAGVTRAAGANPYDALATARGGMAGGTMNGEGTPGITRFFDEQLAGQFSWLLPLALIGLLAWVRRPSSLTLKGFEDAGIAGERGLTLIALLFWLVPGLLFFSFTTTFAHTYYIATIAPPLAALVGIGAVVMYREYLADGWKGWLLVGAVLVTGLLQALFLSYVTAWSGLLIPLVLLGTIGCSGILAYLRIREHAISQYCQKFIVIIALGLLFIAPLVWSCSLLLSGNGNNQPLAGPQPARVGVGMGQGTGYIPGLNRTGFIQDRAGRERLSGLRNASYAPGRSSLALPGMGGASGTQLADYLLAHTTNETWILAVPSAMSGANLIIETGKPVMALGGFSGTDQILDVTSLSSLIKEGKVRYFLTEDFGGVGGGMNSGNGEIFSWVSAHCTAVNLSGDNETGGNVTGAGTTLYDCAGAAGAG